MAENKAYITDNDETKYSTYSSHGKADTIENVIHEFQKNPRTAALENVVTGNPRHQSVEHFSSRSTPLVGQKKALTLWNGVGLIVGAIIGSGIFISPGSVVQYSGSVGLSLIMWVVTGVRCIFGAIIFVELGTMIQKNGSSYVYILEAFGDIPAFVFMWSDTLLGPASGSIVLLTMSTYLIQPLFPNCITSPFWAVRLTAMVVLCVLGYINSKGLKVGAKITNYFSLTKVLALIVIIIAGLVHLAQGNTENYQNAMDGSLYDAPSLATAFYATGFAYGGYQALNMLTGELENPSRNLPLAIAISLTIVTLVYTLTNVAYFAVLSTDEVLASGAVAVTFGNRILGPMYWIIPIFVAISTCGTVNGGMMMEPHQLNAIAKQGHFPRFLALTHVDTHLPLSSLFVSSFLSLLVLAFVPDIGSLFAYTGFAGGLQHIATILALLWLRYKKPDMPRPIKPWIGIPIFYLILSICLVVLPVVKKPIEVIVSLLLLFSGLVAYYFGVYLKIEAIHNVMDKVTHVSQIVFMSVDEDKKD